MIFVLKVVLIIASHTHTHTHTWPVTRFTPKGVTLSETRVALPSYVEVRSDEAQLELSECSPVDLSRG